MATSVSDVQHLPENASHPADREALVGEEAHIISTSSNSPRGTVAVPGMDFDGCYNLVCSSRRPPIIDEQPNECTVEKLRELKSSHEQWARE